MVEERKEIEGRRIILLRNCSKEKEKRDELIVIRGHGVVKVLVVLIEQAENI